MIDELLKKWSELEFDRCEDGRDYWISLKNVRQLGLYVSSPEQKEIDRAAVLEILLQAIVDRGLKMQLENSLPGWRVVLLHPEEVGAPIQVTGQEAAIALLTAYVAWLEKEAQS